MKPNLYLFTNGNQETWPSIQYAAWMASNMQTSVTLAGIVETGGQESALEDMFSDAVALFQQSGVNYRLEIHNGNAEHVIAKLSQADQPTNIFIFGPFGRSSLRHMMTGRSFRQIMAGVPNPILYVREARVPIKKVLVCLGGLSYAATAENLGIRVAGMNGAPITFLHVVPPIDLDYPEARKTKENLQKLPESDTLAGKVLREGLQLAQKYGVTASIKVRNGNIVEEILNELKENSYDLICMGSTHSAHGLRHLYTPNVTAEIAEAVTCPLLSARYSVENVQ